MVENLAGEKRKFRWEAICAAVFTVGWVVCALVIYRIPSQTITGGGSREIMIQNDFLGSVFGAQLVFGIGAFFASTIGLVRSRKARYTVPLAAVVFVNSFFLVGSLFMSSADFQDAAILVENDHTEYHLMTSEFLQSSALLITKFLGNEGLGKKYEVVATSTWKPEYGYSALVRPIGMNKASGLYRTADGVLIGVTDGREAYLSYNPRANEMTEGHDHHHLSPFCLLGPKDEPNQADFSALMKLDPNARPEDEVVAADLKNPNPKVRKMAAELLRKLKANPPTKELN